jgi:hypothetical protein
LVKKCPAITGQSFNLLWSFHPCSGAYTCEPGLRTRGIQMATWSATDANATDHFTANDDWQTAP